jgi:predicted phage terminase large subunit-like protein
VTVVPLTLAEIQAETERRRTGATFEQEAERLKGSLREFLRAAWTTVVPVPLIETWHIDAIADHLQAAYERDIRRLLINVPPGTLKSTIVSVLGPAWRWAVDPTERFVTASWSSDYSERDTRFSRQVLQHPWFQTRFHDATLSTDENLKTRYSNDQGGRRVATYVGGGTGERGDILILDDPHNAKEAQSLDAKQLENARSWWGNTWASRLNDSPERPGVMIVIGQRIHEDDLFGMLLEEPERWTHLCLPGRYETKHPYRYPASVTLPSGRELLGDIRDTEGELLAPTVLSEERLLELATDMTAHVAAGQIQQRPAPQEGGQLKRGDWRYYDPRLSYYRRDGQFGPEQAAALAEFARFDQILHSWDTSLKDGARNDYVAGQIWGIAGANRYLLRLFKERLGLNGTIEAMEELGQWALKVWPRLPHRILVENAANGPDAIAEIRKRLDGVIAITAKGSKEMRVAAAAPALESHNVFVPGFALDDLSGYDSRTPVAVQELIESAAVFPNGAHDDDVDAWSQMVNWTRGQTAAQRATLSRPSGRLPRPGSLVRAGAG